MPLLCERRGAIAVLTLSRPEARNAWCEEFQAGFRQRLPELENDPEIRCVILTGDDKGGAFSAGADLKNPRTHTMDTIAAFIEDLPNRRRSHPIPMLTEFAKPIIAAVNGYAVGIGCIVTYCCDMIVASVGSSRRAASASSPRRGAPFGRQAGSARAWPCARRSASR